MISILAATFVLVLPCRIALADPDAVIRHLQGRVQVRPSGEKKYMDVEAGFPLADLDQIKTGPSSMVQVEFHDGSALLVKENSFFAIGGGPKKTWASFQFGEFLIGLKRALEPGETFLVRTPSAVAAVRGTLFWGFSDAQKNSSWAAFGHKVAITAQNKTVVLEPGQSVKVSYGSPPEQVQPASVGKSYLSTFAIDNDLLDLDKLADPSIQ